jgi:hypothetical protein
VAEVFINYRTGDGDEAAEFLAARLSDRFGKEHVFKASHSIRPGELFPKALIDAARKSEWRSSRPRHPVSRWFR